MTPQELLKPRYEVIADFPKNWNKVGDIIEYSIGQPQILYLNGKDTVPIENYPHLFKRLEWWEERRPEDMPEYVKVLGEMKPFDVFKDSWKNFLAQTKSEFSPVTKEEYEQFLKDTGDKVNN